MTPSPNIVEVVKYLQSQKSLLDSWDTYGTRRDGDEKQKKIRDWESFATYNFPSIAESLLVAVEALERQNKLTSEVTDGSSALVICGQVNANAEEALQKIYSQKA